MGLNPNLTTISVTPSGGSAITFCETNITPFGFAGSGKINDTSSCSTAESNGKVIKEYLPGDFIEISDGGATVQYDPAETASIIAALNVDGSIVFTYNDGGTDTIPGWIQSFTPQGVATVDNEEVWLADIVLQSAGGTSGTPTYVAPV